MATPHTPFAAFKVCLTQMARPAYHLFGRSMHEILSSCSTGPLHDVGYWVPVHISHEVSVSWRWSCIFGVPPQWRISYALVATSMLADNTDFVLIHLALASMAGPSNSYPDRLCCSYPTAVFLVFGCEFFAEIYVDASIT